MKNLFAILILLAAAGPSLADEVVPIGSGYALLNRPTGTAKAGLVLIPGGDGNLGLGSEGRILPNQEPTTLPRNRKTLAALGMATLLIDNQVSIGQASIYLKDIAQPVVVIALSRGSTRIKEIVAARPSGVVLLSSLLNFVQMNVTASSLPPTLVIHHRQDACPETLPGLVAPFQTWAGAKARVVWIDGGENKGSACYGLGYHGLAGRDAEFRAAVLAFASELGPANPVATTAVGNSMAKAFSRDAKGPPLPKSGPPPRCKSC
jgi:hypothetical protein